MRRKRPEPAVEYNALGRILDRRDLAQLPKLEPLIDDWLDLRTSVVMPGDTGTNKTFVATVGWACSIATGVPWLGHEVRIEPCTVILVVGEGEYGLNARISAWEAEAGVKVPRQRIKVLIRPDVLKEAFWEELSLLAVQEGARFVVLDTLSSLAPAMDETKEAATILHNMNELVARIDGTVVLLHHTGWNDKGRARGGTQFEQNADAVIVLQKTSATDPDSPVDLWRKKVKDGPSGAKLTVRREPVGDSCVLEVVADNEKLGRSKVLLTRTEVVRAIFRLLDTEPLMHTSDAALKLLMKEIGNGTTRAYARKVWGEAETEGLIRHRRAKGKEGRLRDRWEWVPAAEVPPTP